MEEHELTQEQHDLVKRIQQSNLGAKLGEELCVRIVRSASRVDWTADSVIFSEDERATSAYILTRGRIKLTRYSHDGREVILHIAEPPMMVAEAALILGRYPASAITLEPTTLLRIRKEDMLEWMDGYPEYRRHVFETMSQWMERLVERIDRLSLNDVASRLIYYLLSLPIIVVDGVQKVELPVKKSEVASLLNMNQATLSRALRNLQDLNLIEVRGSDILFRDLDGLQAALRGSLL
jgi:CRP/FNR family transcriptional regulator